MLTPPMLPRWWVSIWKARSSALKRWAHKTPPTCSSAMRQCFVACRMRRAAKIKLVDIAPRPGALEFVDEMHDDVRISVAHTCANYDQAAEAFRRGAKHVTHLYNAMPGLHHRKPGVIPAALGRARLPRLLPMACIFTPPWCALRSRCLVPSA